MTVYLGRSAGHRNLDPSKMTMRMIGMPLGIESAKWGAERLSRSYQLANLPTYLPTELHCHIRDIQNIPKEKHPVAW